MLSIQTFTFNQFAENTFLLYDQTGEAVIIDAGCYSYAEQQMLKRFLQEKNLRIVKILNTHCHIDHVLGNAFVKSLFPKAPIIMHQADLPTLEACKGVALMYGFSNYQPTEPDSFVQEGDKITFGTQKLEVLFVPGHALGHIAFIHHEQKRCFSGDVLFEGSIGRYDFPGCNLNDLIHSILHKLLALPNDYTVHPGHGNLTTIGKERQYNPFVREWMGR
ncbi:MAG: MBL fold metallo-hydrolase [Microscillaceae bacterium]|nr:MBL fold metallo-hydrolase [Microscillaceae bacterium]MDW8461256.1 MBL fold metallo-hydrolase [Cytophagales bacterium]